jgi:hypothetical protein
MRGSSGGAWCLGVQPCQPTRCRLVGPSHGVPAGSNSNALVDLGAAFGCEQGVDFIFASFIRQGEQVPCPKTAASGASSSQQAWLQAPDQGLAAPLRAARRQATLAAARAPSRMDLGPAGTDST